MKQLRVAFFIFLLLGISGTVVVLLKTPVNTPFARSLSPLFQELGKSVKTVDRVMSKMVPLDDLDEQALGIQTKAYFDEVAQPKTASEIEIVQYLNDLASSLTENCKKPFQYQVYLIDSGVNAYACAGGVICISKSLFDILETESELVAILGHEIGHVERGHTFDLCRDRMLEMKMPEASVVTFVSEMIHSITKITFSKTQENEADEYAFQLLTEHGYTPYGVADAFNKLLQVSYKKQINHFDEFFASHPHTEIRMEKFRSKAKQWASHHIGEPCYVGKQNYSQRVFMKKQAFSSEIVTASSL